jgi:hypothetical protein
MAIDETDARARVTLDASGTIRAADAVPSSPSRPAGQKAAALAARLVGARPESDGAVRSEAAPATIVCDFGWRSRG